MTLQQIISHFRSRRYAAKCLDINFGTMNNWIIRGNGEVPKYWHAHIKQNAAKYGIVIDQIT